MFTVEQLVDISKGFNRYLEKVHPDVKQIDIVSDKASLLEQIEERFNQIGGMNERTVRSIIKEMKPLGPEKATQWLSSDDIREVMRKYEEENPDFQFIGALPLDCDAYSFCPLQKIQFDNSHKIGIIYNLDRHGQSGSHWVSMFIDTDTCSIYFSDSMGKPPKDNMLNIINRFKEWCSKKGCETTYKFNTKRYQTDNSECGVYSCNFIIQLLHGKSYEEVINNPLNFQEINSCRNVYFSNNPSSYEPSKRCE